MTDQTTATPSRASLKRSSLPVVAVLTIPVLFVVQMATASPISAQVVRGQVTDAETHQPVPAARIAVRTQADSLLTQVVSSTNGEFILLGLPTGRLVLEVSALGYTASAERRIDHQDKAIFLSIELHPSPLEAEGIRVTVEAQDPVLRDGGYYRRKQIGHGYFITPEQIDRMSLMRPSDLFRRIASVSVVGNGEPKIRRGVSSFRECLPAVVQDGMLVRPSHSSAAFNDAVVPAVWIRAVEVYPGPASAPPEWRGSSACGLILIWTRH